MLTPKEAQEFRKLQRKWGKESQLTPTEMDRWLELDRKRGGAGVRKETVDGR